MKTHPIETFFLTWLLAMFVGANIDMSHHTSAGALVVLVVLVTPFILNSIELLDKKWHKPTGHPGEYADDQEVFNQVTSDSIVKSVTLVVVWFVLITKVPTASGIPENDITHVWFMPVLWMSVGATVAYFIVAQTTGWIASKLNK